MAVKTLLPQTGNVGVGSTVNFPTSDTVRVIQVNPQAGHGFSGTLVIEGSSAASPGNNDWVSVATIVMMGHTQNFSLDIQSSVTWMRARISASTSGAVAVYGNSKTGNISGGTGSGGPYTAIVNSPVKVGVIGNGVQISSPVVPSFTTDDVVYSADINKTLTEVLAGKQDALGGGNITASAADLNVLVGASSAGLDNTDIIKLAQTNASAVELNHLVGVSSNVQTQLTNLLNNKATGPGVDLTGLSVSASALNNFFDEAATVKISDINDTLGGLTASAADLNALSGTAGQFTSSDLVKLGDITASAADLNKLSGFTGSASDMNKLVGLTASTADLNTLNGLAGNSVGTAQMVHLAGLTENVQDALDTIPNLGGLTASVADLNRLTGAATGSGAYSSTVTPTEISYLSGVTSAIQTQLNSKRSVGTPISIGEINGASINIVELNHLSGVSSNIQTQLNNIANTFLSSAGGTFTGQIRIMNGTAAAPGLGYAGSINTGLYLHSGNAIGLTVAGTRAAIFDGTDFIMGSGSVGSPLMKGAGFAVTDPAFSFAGDDDTGIYRVGADSIGIAAGGANMMTLDANADQITIGGASTDNNSVSVSGVFGGEKLLGRATVLAGTVTGATGTTALYTVPTGRSAIITRVLVRLANISNYAGGPNALRMNIGWSGTAYDELVDNTNNATIFNPATYDFDTVGQVLPLGVGDNTFPAICGSAGGDYGIMTAGQTLNANVTVQSGADAWDMDVIVFGFEFK